MRKFGDVYWVTGLSGAGKTTIAKLLYEKLKKNKDNVVFLDGDILREIFGNDLGYSSSDRKKSAMRNSRICKELSEQGIDVVCATISMFNECRIWNRENIKNYKEIYIKVPIEILIQRDQKKLYSRALKGEIKNVMGIDIDFEEPKNPDIVILNDGSVKPKDILSQII
ncbi:adenylyl-sulfate kinase [Clostridium sp. MB40-C1]|uniref:adenylyl-sulfate kinase n=1 Tax=Clostridium sp. MB40-C1 TaxID=3070996 RepID=UPI0027DECE5E|nr:adenylyl-sulfate kinase [Clostridium sp. MB40-C1]WMJ81318.1 adenylyl-sulfate kinase [Clostridium sp. MB40-C1]